MNEISVTSSSHASFSFILNERVVELSGFPPDELLLDYIREQNRLTGTKEGCAEGDCGACTVLVGRLHNGNLEYKSVNSCIQFMAGLNAKHVITIEALADGALVTLQEAMVKYHGSQCGFCTPGIMMSLFAVFIGNANPTAQDIEIALQGNLCRCTGYEPIIKAALSFIGDTSCAEWLNVQRKTISKTLQLLTPKNMIEIGEKDKKAFLPNSVEDIATCLNENQNATLISGATDVGLWVTKQFRDISPAIFIGDVQELEAISHDEGGLIIGANSTYTKSLRHLKTYHAAFEKLINRIGGAQVRNAGTIGGNIANGSPIGDMSPALIAINATMNLRSVSGARQIALEDFFIEYGRQDLRSDEFIESIYLPPIRASQKIEFYKISKRRDEDISSVMAAFNFEIKSGVIQNPNIVFGGMAETPKRAKHAESALLGKPLSEATMQGAAEQLPKDFSPLSDWRASANYRMQVAQNLFVKCLIDMEKKAVSDAT